MTASDPTYPAFPVLALIGVVLVLIPLPWHFQAWNSGTCLYMIWTALGLLNLAINSIVWRSSVINYAPVWCDISSRLIVGVSVAIPAASLCINRRLYKIATISTVTTTKAHRRRAIMVDLAIALGIPMLQMVLQFIVEGHRFNIFEEIGCYPFTYNTWLAYPLSNLWPLVIGLISAVYCVLTLRAFMKRRAQFSEFLSSNTSLSINRYFRLMALATLELLCTTPISAYGIYINLVDNPLEPWKGFADAHYNYSRVGQYPSVIWRLDSLTIVSTELTRWSLVFCALSFFAFFGFADEARKNYRKAFWAIAKLFGFPPPLPAGASHIRAPPRPIPVMSSIGSLPAYSPPSSKSSKFLSTSTLDIKVEKDLYSYVVDDRSSLPDTPTSMFGLAHDIGPHAV
ncbi:pheromone receptor Rcb3 B43 [Suillus paluster]|uniref:pheromone receptor Rcb3 B43 n=1 Tax=Suillus paluster TaxID=48578 RepID=UPI001B876AD9|nr:pheromone receptor Rcb3 B43 [Suillus paluster]KAG1750489.1 pheromone receptor Rcb3 B43 [Suillus paluster]